jgi:hypothetical protein
MMLGFRAQGFLKTAIHSLKKWLSIFTGEEESIFSVYVVEPEKRLSILKANAFFTS